MTERELFIDDADATETIESEEPDPDLTICQRMQFAIRDARAVEKNVEVRSRDKKLLYSGVAHGDVSDACRAVMQRWGILPLFSVVKSDQVGTNMCRVTLKIEYVNVDDPADRISGEWIGDGADQSDNGSKKATTSAAKAGLWRQFMLSTDDGSDRHSSAPIIEDVGAIPPGKIPAQLWVSILTWAKVPIGAGDDEKTEAFEKYSKARGVDLRTARAEGDISTMRGELRYCLEAIAYRWDWSEFLKDPRHFTSAHASRAPGRSTREMLAAAAEESGNGGDE